ncbi:hypothetical protein [Streptomyces sp. 6N223]|uniref:hypothetical protein n=1 Tax=Streptomyces sp. 6N223 TaxID=3457412 RepID=UPI003FD04FE9
MRTRAGTGTGLDVLVGLVESREAEKVRRRLRVAARSGAGADLSPMRLVAELTLNGMPMTGVLWLLERDDPVINKAVYHQTNVPNAIRRDILRGVPFGPGARAGADVAGERIAVSRDLAGIAEPDIPAAREPGGPIAALRRAYTMRQGRAAANAVSRADWPRVAEADRAEPLPGYARWALAVRIDCPPEVRAQFGTHPKFAHRLRQAGIASGPREYVERWRPARNVLAVLGLGREAFPARVAEAGDALRPLVRRELGGHVGAWLALARLLPAFEGTLPGLIAAASASSDAA